VRRTRFTVAIMLAGILAVTGCASKPKAPVTGQDPETSSIQAEATGLAPAGDTRYQSIDFAVLFGSREAVASWSVVIADVKKNAVRTIKGDGADLSDKISWDAKSDTGIMAAEGTYVANLAVDYGDKFKIGRASSKPFILDIKRLAPPSPRTRLNSPMLLAESPRRFRSRYRLRPDSRRSSAGESTCSTPPVTR